MNEDMITAEFIDGLTLSADTFDDILMRLFDEAHFDTSPTLDEYMRAVARRARIQTGEPLFYSDAETFVNELKRVGIITKLESDH